MSSELLSTARPSGLRLLGFLALAGGALLAGIGATMTWATVGFPRDIAGNADVPVKGTDVWEGVVVLAIAAACLVATVLMRVAASTRTRTVVAACVAVGGLVVVALTALDLATATDRFGGSAGLADIARRIAARLGQPVERVRALLEQSFGANLRVDTGAGLILALAGGVLLAAAGALSIAWASSSASPPLAGIEPPGDSGGPQG
jgi:hypothetical protein